MKSLFFLLFLLVTATSAQATTWYTGTGGSNSNTCAQAQTHATRKLTVAAGLACMASAGGGGHTLAITAGTYNETGLTLTSGTVSARNTITNFGSDQVNFTNTGSVAVGTFAINSGLQYINIVGTCTTGTGRTCTMDFDKSPMGFEKASLGGSQNITIDGVRIHNVVVGGSISSGVAVNIAGDNITFKNCRIDHNGTTPDVEGQAGYAFYIGGSNNTVENCELDNQGGYAIHQYSGDQTPSNNTYRYNRIHDNGQLVTGNVADGILLSGAGTPSNNAAYSNIIWNNRRGYGIRVNPCTNCFIYNNTVYSNGADVGADGITVWAGSGTVIRNNIVSSNAVAQISVTGGSPTGGTNICSSVGSSGLCTSIEAATTSMVSPSTSDFTLKTGSVALDGGSTLASPYNRDILNLLRPQGVSFDIGAYEQAGGLPVITITGPTSTATLDTSSTTISSISGSSDLSSGSVTWSCDRCTPTTGTATGTLAWATSPITLKAGINIFTVTATTGGGASSTDTLTITYAPSFPGNSLALAMGFENGSGSTVTDLSGAGNTGTLVGSPTWVGTSGGRYGNAVQFDGVGGQYMTVPDANSLDFTQSLTISMWVKPSASISDYRSLVAKVAIPLGPPYRLFAGVSGECGTGGISGFVRSNGASGPEDQACHATALAPNVWTHVAFTYDGANLRLYKNGALMTTTAHTGYIEPSTGILYVARSEFGEYFAGAIDELRIYNHAIPRTTTNNATFGAACASAEEIATPSVVGDANCPLVPLAPPIAFKISATSTIKLGADQTQKIGGATP